MRPTSVSLRSESDDLAERENIGQTVNSKLPVKINKNKILKDIHFFNRVEATDMGKDFFDQQRVSFATEWEPKPQDYGVILSLKFSIISQN